MRLGCCGSIDNIADVKAAGFDFLEVHIQHVLQGDKDDATWAATAPDPAKLPLPIEAANCLLPASLPVIGERRDLKTLEAYMERIAARAAKVGIRRLVFGSGGARKRPEDIDDNTAFKHLVEFTQLAGDACGNHDVTLVIEHLNEGETNTLNSLHDALKLCEKVNHQAVQMLVDSYHYGLEQEEDAALLALANRLMHVHVAEPIDRIQPGGHADPDKSFDFQHFFSLCRKIGYDDRISFEGKWTVPMKEAGPEVIRLLRKAWNQAG